MHHHPHQGHKAQIIWTPSKQGGINVAIFLKFLKLQASIVASSAVTFSIVVDVFLLLLLLLWLLWLLHVFVAVHVQGVVLMKIKRNKT